MMTRIAALALLAMGLATPAYAIQPTAMPEPGLFGLAALGVVGAILIVRRKR